ncbi:MAG: hypothetical protein LBQ24_06880 [Candidatus Peribacteria bacterium]|jgi:hypothetical protein|nr:hypothetical protein [Candidatus Peribacteria bacterium]
MTNNNKDTSLENLKKYAYSKYDEINNTYLSATRQINNSLVKLAEEE